MGKWTLSIAALLACAAMAQTSVTQQPLPYARMAEHIANSLKPAKGEAAMVRFDPAVLPELQPATRAALEKRGVKVDSLPYGPVERFAERLVQTDIYIWLPTTPGRGPEPDQAAALVRWLDAGRGRQIHFHWGDGTRAVDSTTGEHTADFDRIYVAALEIDYAALDKAQQRAVGELRGGEIRVTTPQGTDLRFRIGDRPVTKQNGDASPAAMKRARTRIDREIELPAGAIRVAPLEETVEGLVVIPSARIQGEMVEGIRLRFSKGKIVQTAASRGLARLSAYFKAAPALTNFREFALGFNPRLAAPAGSPWVAYYGYGRGMVRLSLGDNSELGGKVTGGAVHWFFFPGAKVTVNEKPLD